MHRLISLSIAVFMLSAAMTAYALPTTRGCESSGADQSCTQTGAHDAASIVQSKVQQQSASLTGISRSLYKRRAHDEPDEDERDENEKDENEKDENEKDENEKDEDENEEDEEEEDEDEKDEH